MKHSSPPGYRADIDGLRALAIAAVVAYHAGLPGVPGGYVGVDIFFVLSGYLITRHLSEELAKSGTLSFRAFYARRMRRLLPALAFTVVGTCLLRLCFVPFTNVPKKFASSALAAIAGFANIFFKKNTGGYFDGSAEEMPLLHFWSLGVEEQFYLFWPLLLCAALALRPSFAKRHLRATLGTLLGVISVVSFFFAERALSQGKSSAAFYLTPYRAWEFGAGGLLALSWFELNRTLSSRGREGMALAGLGLVGYAIAAFDGQTRFPGVAALLPVLGTVMMLAAYRNHAPTRVHRFFSVRPLVFVGLLSYGWYLWHWPMLAMARTWYFGETPAWVRAAAVALSFGLAWLSLRFVERPVREGRFWRSLPPGRVLSAGFALIAAVALITRAQVPLEWWMLARRVGKEAVTQFTYVPPLNKTCIRPEQHGTPPCEYRYGPEPDRPYLAVWGDSHACSYFPMLEAYGESRSLEIGRFCQSEASPIAVETTEGTIAIQRLREKVRENPSRPVGALIATRWIRNAGLAPMARDYAAAVSMADTANVEKRYQLLGERLTKTLSELARAGVKRTLLVLPSPEFPYQAPSCLPRGPERCAVTRAKQEEYRGRIVAEVRRVAAKFPGVRLIDPVDALCDQEQCPQLLSGGIPTVEDANHPTKGAVERVGRHFRAELDWLAGAKEPVPAPAHQRTGKP